MSTDTYIGGSGGLFGAEKAPRPPADAANTLRSISTARILDLVSEGEIVGLVDGTKSVYFDDTPLVDQSGRVNYQNVTVLSRHGLPDQTPIPGFSSVESELLSSSLQVVNATPVVQTVSDLSATRARVTARISQLWAANATTGHVTRHSLKIKIEVKPNVGAYVQVVLETIQGKCVSPYEKAYSIPLDGDGPWSIRLTRVSADYDNITAAGDLFWVGLTQIIDHKLIYPDSAMFGVICDSQTFGGRIPVRSYLIDGIKSPVPSNYNPVTRVYTGVWDGTFTTAWHSNPAWALWDLIVNNRYGLGDFISASVPDKWSLYQISQYCDEMVDDGLGGLEPRYSFNCRIADRDEAYRVLMSLASVFRGMVHWSSGSIMASADMPSDPVKLVTPANVIDGEFTYQGDADNTRHSVVLVTWNDPSDAYRPNIEVVEDPELIDRFGYKPIEIAAVGCTSRGQARRYGGWVLETEKYETEVVSYSCSWDHADLLPGQLIAVADPSYMGARVGGRIVTAGLLSVTVDSEVTLDSSSVYTLDVVLPSGAINSRQVTNVPGTYTTLVLETSLDLTPLSGAVWILSSSSLTPRPFCVISVTERSKQIFEVNALLHSPGKYARVESGIVVEDPVYTRLPSGALAPPGSIGYDQYLYEEGGVLLGAVSVSWNKSTDPRVVRYELWDARLGLDYARVVVQDETSFEITGISRTETSISLRVRALDDLGRDSDWVTAAAVPLTMFTEAPPDVTGLRGSALGDTLLLTWDATTDKSVDHYVLKFSTSLSGATWGSAQSVQDNVRGSSTSIPSKSGTVLIKAVSLSGVESLNAILYSTNSDGLSTTNAVETVDDTPTWPGTHTNTQVTSGSLRLVDFEVDGLYVFNGYTDIGDVYTSRVSVFVTVVGENINNNMSGWVPLSSVLSMSGADPSAWSILFEERHTLDNPAGTPTWSAWTELSVADITARAYEFQVHLHSDVSGITPVISALAITIDMPDRHVADKDVASGTGAGGFQVVFSPPFHSLKAVTISYTGQVTGDTYEWVSKDNTQFTIRFKNSAGTVVSRSFDYDAIGYGSQVP